MALYILNKAGVLTSIGGDGFLGEVSQWAVGAEVQADE